MRRNYAIGRPCSKCKGEGELYTGAYSICSHCNGTGIKPTIAARGTLYYRTWICLDDTELTVKFNWRKAFLGLEQSSRALLTDVEYAELMTIIERSYEKYDV